MNRFDLLKQVDISLAARLIVELGNMFQDNNAKVVAPSKMSLRFPQ